MTSGCECGGSIHLSGWLDSMMCTKYLDIMVLHMNYFKCSYMLANQTLKFSLITTENIWRHKNVGLLSLKEHYTD